MKKILSALIISVLSLSSYANDFEAALSSKTAQFSMYSDSSVIGWGGSDLVLRLMYNEASDVLGQAELISVRQADKNTPLTLGAGVKAYLGRLDAISKDVVAVGIGGSLNYVIPGTMPITLYSTLFYAPEITTFAGSKQIKDFNFGVKIEAMPQTHMFVGYRRINIDTDAINDFKFDDGHLHFGIRLTF